MKISLKSQARAALVYFLLAALLGTMLRMFQWQPFPVNFRYVVHAHSHIALLGWVYVALTTLIYKQTLIHTFSQRRYQQIFWLTQGTLLGMLCTFPFQGYALFSIIFSTLFLLVSYRFAWAFFRFAARELRSSNAYRFLKAAVFYMVFSSVGPWSLGLIMSTVGVASPWYRNAVYFYLHFQYNGWMPMALLGLLILAAERQGIRLPGQKFKWIFRCLNAGIVFSFLLSVLWMEPPALIYLVAGAGALLQATGYALLAQGVYREWGKFRQGFTLLQRRILGLSAVFLGIKLLLQILTSLPYFARLAASVLEFTIGYLHWTFLGVISLCLFVLLDFYRLIPIPPVALRVYLAGFVVTESLIIYKGLAAWVHWPLMGSYQAYLAIGSALLPLGIAGWIIRRSRDISKGNP